jgi:hypothetical protein
MDGYVQGWDALVARVEGLEAENAMLISYINGVIVPFTEAVEMDVAELLNHTHTFESGPPVVDESPAPIYGSIYGVGPYGEESYGE